MGGEGIDQLDAVLRHIDSSIGRDSSCWMQWPGGWPDDIESALVDAVFSARAVYRTRHGRGVHQQVTKWRDGRTGAGSTLRDLRDEIAAAHPETWASKTFENEQRSPGRRPNAPGGPTKAAAVLEAANRLLDANIATASDLTDSTAGEAKRALRSVAGIGYATTNYFFMLLGRPGVKPDRMIHRFVKDATSHQHTSVRAEELITRAAEVLDVAPHELEHAIWKYESDRAATRS